MRVKIVNTTSFNKFVDIGGSNKPEEIVVIGPKGSTVQEISSSKQLASLRGKFKDLTFVVIK